MVASLAYGARCEHATRQMRAPSGEPTPNAAYYGCSGVTLLDSGLEGLPD